MTRKIPPGKTIDRTMLESIIAAKNAEIASLRRINARLRKFLQLIYRTKKGYQDVCWQYADDALNNKEPPSEMTNKWYPTCPYCQKPRIEDDRGLCSECGAEKTDEVRQQEMLFKFISYAFRMAYYSWACRKDC